MRRAFFVLTVLSLGLSPARAGQLEEYGAYLAGECTTCHSKDAKAAADTGIPALADISGWDAASFIAVMTSFTNGERENAAMGSVAKALDGEQMKALAAHFASIKPPEEKAAAAPAKPVAKEAAPTVAKAPAAAPAAAKPAAAPAAAPADPKPAAASKPAAAAKAGAPPSAAEKQLREYGAYLAGECTTCHSKDAKAAADTGIPALADISGWDAASFIAVMASFTNGERENAAMGSVAKALDGEQMKALATYFASQKPPGDSGQAPAKPDAVKQAAPKAAPAVPATKTAALKQSIESTAKAIAAGGDLRFKPSYITAPHRKLTPDDWTDPAICGQCHSRQYEGWKGSMHANAFKDPVFQALWAIGEKATNGRFKNHCSGCHSPIGTVTQTIKFDPKLGKHGGFTAPGVAAKGVSCDVCHTIKDTNFQRTATLEHGNASFVMDPGNTKRATIKNASSPYHDTAYSELHSSSKFCGNCHNIFHPVNKFPIERTYDEWKYSIYAQNGIQCMDCHMVPVSTAIRVADELKRPHDLDNSQIGGFAGLGGPWRKVVHDHYFVGGNTVITAALQGKKSLNYEQALQRLQSVASLKLFVKPRKKSKGLHRLKVRVTNERAGHNLPTSLTEVRQIWLEVVVTDDTGRELLRSGTMDDKRALPEDVVIFNAHAVDKNGKHTAYPWEITRFTDANTIPPKGYKYGKYAFYVPPGVKSVKISAKLHYRSFSQELADLLLGKGKVTVPAVEMASIEQSFAVADRLVGPAPTATHKKTGAGGKK